MARFATSWVERHPGAPLYAVAAALVALAGVHVLLDDDPLLSAGLQGLVVATIAIAPFAVAVGMGDHGFDDHQALRVLGVTVGGAIYGAALGGSYVALMLLEGGTYDEPLFGVLVGLAGGVGFGAPIGYYYQALERQRGELHEEIDRSRSLNKRLRVTERALRHNLRNELTVLYGVADELSDLVDGAPVRRLESRLDHLATLSENTHRLTQIWDVEGTAELDVGELLAACIDELREAHPGVVLDGSGVRSARARVHPNFEYAIEEALDNAVTHNDPEGLHVDVDVVSDGEWVTVTVADDGCGIPSLDTGALAQPEETPLEHGRGLGLWVIYWAVEASGGDLAFENGDGATVRMRLPGV